jgi:hypothetical protein
MWVSPINFIFINIYILISIFIENSAVYKPSNIIKPIQVFRDELNEFALKVINYVHIIYKMGF